MATHTALICILCEAGLAYRRAQHIAREIDRQRLCGLSSDDFAALLLTWSNKRLYTRLIASQEQINKLLGVTDDQLPLFSPN